MQFAGDNVITVPPGGFSAVYAFGDSLSDAGNVSFATARTVPMAPYSDGRFTNGEVWVQTLSTDLGLPPVAPRLAGGTDYAWGGALTGPSIVHTANPTDLTAQLGEYAATISSPQPNALYTVWAGGNDVLTIANDTALTPAQQSTAVQQAVSNEVGVVGGLVARGAQHILVLNVPDIGHTPYETQRGPTVSAEATTLSQEYNASLAAQLQNLVASTGVDLTLVDTYSLLDGVIANPTAYGFTNATQPVWNGSLTDPTSGTLAATGAAQNQYVFFDSLHPTSQAHALLGNGVAQQVFGV
jgi:phospholipase/lecithinase/hemolysin